MVFSSLVFLFRFLPFALLLYYLVPWRWKNLTLLVLSMFFYSWGEVRHFPLMLYSIVLDYSCSRGIEKYREKRGMPQLFLALSLVGNLGLLVFFKYSGFMIETMNALLGTSLIAPTLTLPLGISFYTFQTLSYTIDVYRGDVKAERNIIDFGAFVTLFPQLIAGPIVRYTDISNALKKRTLNLGSIASGIQLFILGLSSKVLIANNIGSLWTELETVGFAQLSTPLAMMGLVAYALQIYFDFSGYSWMAIGLGRMLGFEFPQNFNYPYIARSATEFWRRWHMTLGSWFREYLYFPLGGSRRGAKRTYLNLLVVWAATGLWHGASWNFLLWGLYFFVLIVLEKAFLLKFLNRHRILSHAYLLLAVLFSWAIFAVPNMQNLGALMGRLFIFKGGIDWIYYLRNYAVVLLLGCALATPVFKKAFQRITQYAVPSMLIYGAILLVCVAYLVDASYNPFLYFRF